MTTTDIPSLAKTARSEYDRRYAACVALEKSGDFDHDTADRLHNWERIAWMFDPDGRKPDERHLIYQENLDEMAAEVAKCRDLLFKKCEARPDDKELNIRTRGLMYLATELELRANSLRKVNQMGRHMGEQARRKKAA